jgi:hypothetical protein
MSEVLRELNSADASTGAGFGGGRAAFGGMPDDFRAGAAEQLHLPPPAEAPLISSFGFSSSHFRFVNPFFTFGEQSTISPTSRFSTSFASGRH